tara:strand:- start:1730 stop:1963 length:234 start_codon:yes stop_codon:yes gene_type:complete
MENKELIMELVDRLLVVENELKILQDDRKELLSEYKEKIDIKAFKAAVQIAKIRSRLGDSEIALDDIMDQVVKKICL